MKATALGVFIFSSMSAIAAFVTGEKAEKNTKEIAGVSETLIHEHEEQAELFYTLMLLLGALSIIALLLQAKKSKFTIYVYFIILILRIVDGVIASSVGTTGGKISHAEIISDTNVIQIERE